MNPRRAIFAWLLALGVAVVLSGGGCASGGSTSAGGGEAGPGDGARGDGLVEGGEGGDSSGCGAGRALCGADCVNTSTDPLNCGQCGVVCPDDQVCSGGFCGTTCGPGETICGGAVDAGAVVDSGRPRKDAAVDDSGPAAGDGGAVHPFCTNTGSDPGNCGGCGIDCGPTGLCVMGSCSMNCGAGQKACAAVDMCIPDGTCCTSNDCAVTGEICPMPGGTCQCPSGENMCPASNSCVSSSQCCTDSDCTVAGQVCSTPGQPCTCMSGAQCCVPADCPSEPHVAGDGCTNNKCTVTKCSAGCYDLDSTFGNGCECCVDGNGQTCATATAGAALTVGGAKQSFSGVLPSPTGEDWFTVTFNSEPNIAFHGLITLSTNPKGQFVFDILQASCTGTPLPCGEGGSCTAMTTWEESYVGPSPMADPTDPTFKAVPTVGTVFIRVHRASTSNAATCDGYVLDVSE